MAEREIGVIAITGGCGFLGSALVWHLNRMGRQDIAIVDDLGLGQKFRNVTGLLFADYFDKHDFLERIHGKGTLPPLEAIVHLGACSATTEEDGSFLMKNNFSYSRDIAEWCLRTGVRLVYASSAATYGDGRFGFDDDMTLAPRLRPLNKYSFSKQAFDLWAFANGALEHITGLKYFNVFGPNEYHKAEMRSMVLKAFEQIRDTGSVKLFRSHRPDYGDGEQARDFIYVKDAVRITAWFLEHPEATGLFNVGTGTARTWNALATAVFHAMDREPRIEYIDMPVNIRNGYQYNTCAGMHRLLATGCPQAEYSLEEAVYDYVRHHLMQPDSYLTI